MTSSIDSKWVLVVMDDPQLRRLYVRLLERRGHHIIATADHDEAHRLISGDRLDLAVVDNDLHGDLIDGWDELDAPPLVVLTTPPADDAAAAPLALQARDDIELILHKPLSPMEFGIQVDYLLGETGDRDLREDSESDRDFNALQREFIYQLDEDLGRLDDAWREVIDDRTAPQRAASRLRRLIAPLRSASRRYGFGELSDRFDRFEALAEALMAPDQQLDDGQQTRGQKLLDGLHDDCQQLQQDHRPRVSNPDYDSRQQTLLVVDPDRDYLDTLEQFGDQFVLRIRTARDLEEARRRVQTPLLAGVLLSVSATSSMSSLQDAIDQLREASPLESLPLALVGDDGQDLDRVRSLWAGASMLLSKPVTNSKFSRAVRRLTSLREAQQASILVIETDDHFAELLRTHLDTGRMAVHSHDQPSSLFSSLDRHRPDLVMVDSHIPVVSSFDVCRALRAIPRWQDIPIIMVADEQNEELRLAAYEAGADDFFGGDISTEELQARVQIRLRRARMTRQRIDRDGLTGLLTRRAFLERLAGRLSEVTRHGRPLVFALLDVDHFKEVNDRYGHPAGDRVLKTLGQLLRDRFRIEDLRARWGGEEFAIVLVDEQPATARKALDRVRSEFCGMEFSGEQGQRFQVSFSAGLAGFPDDGHDAETLLSAADSRLLRAKRAGRNQLVVGHDG